VTRGKQKFEILIPSPQRPSNTHPQPLTPSRTTPSLSLLQYCRDFCPRFLGITTFTLPITTVITTLPRYFCWIAYQCYSLLECAWLLHTGWTGSDCTSVDACFSSPCQNGAECHNDHDTYFCSCPLHFTGMLTSFSAIDNKKFT